MQVLPWLGSAEPSNWVNAFPCMLDGGSTWGWLFGKHQDAKKAKKKIRVGRSSQNPTSFLLSASSENGPAYSRIDYYDNGGLHWKGPVEALLWGRGNSYSIYNFGKLPIPLQSAGSTQTTESHWILQAGLVFIMICPLSDFGLSTSGPLLELCCFFPLLDRHCNSIISLLAITLLLKLTGNPLTFWG